MTRDRRLQWALALNALLVALQVAFGIGAHSLGLVADAGHNFTDAAAIGLALFAVRLTYRPATARRSYGYHRSTILAAQANAAAILVVTALILAEAIRRFVHPIAIHTGPVIAVAAVATVVNLGAASVLHEDGHDLNMRASLLHMLGDALTSAGVLVAAIVMRITGGFGWLDPALSVLIGLVIGVRAVQLLRATTSVLLESTPESIDLGELGAAMMAVAGVEAVHDLHTWSLSSEVHALSAHVVLEGEPTLEEAQRITASVKHTLAERFRISHATIEAEAEHCHPEQLDDCVMHPETPLQRGLAR
jgi:cobalt-zinc-cadmium efflux system protein